MKRSALFVAAFVIFVLGITLTASAHTDSELIEWKAGWYERVEERGGALSMRLMEEYRDMIERHPCRSVIDTWYDSCNPSDPPRHASPSRSGNPSPSAGSGMGSNVEQWRPIVEQYFGDNTNAALRVMACESGGNPNAKNPRSSASGLFQFLASTWTSTTGETYPGNVFDGPSNIAAAAKLSNGGSNWSQWSCKP